MSFYFVIIGTSTLSVPIGLKVIIVKFYLVHKCIVNSKRISVMNASLLLELILRCWIFWPGRNIRKQHSMNSEDRSGDLEHFLKAQYIWKYMYA